MNPFTFTYSFSDAPEVLTKTIECESLADAFSLFYDQTTDVAFDSVPTIHDLEIYYDNESSLCDRCNKRLSRKERNR